MKISQLPVRSDSKTRVLPSLENHGCPSFAGERVTRVRCVPSMRASKMSSVPLLESFDCQATH